MQLKRHVINGGVVLAMVTGLVMGGLPTAQAATIEGQSAITTAQVTNGPTLPVTATLDLTYDLDLTQLDLHTTDALVVQVPTALLPVQSEPVTVTDERGNGLNTMSAAVRHHQLRLTVATTATWPSRVKVFWTAKVQAPTVGKQTLTFPNGDHQTLTLTAAETTSTSSSRLTTSSAAAEVAQTAPKKTTTATSRAAHVATQPKRRVKATTAPVTAQVIDHSSAVASTTSDAEASSVAPRAQTASHERHSALKPVVVTKEAAPVKHRKHLPQTNEQRSRMVLMGALASGVVGLIGFGLFRRRG